MRFASPRQTFGAAKCDDYAALIEEALGTLAVNPEAGRARPEIDPEARVVHIGQPGRKARHVLLYRIVDPDLVEILAVAHDAMDLPRRWRSRE